VEGEGRRGGGAGDAGGYGGGGRGRHGGAAREGEPGPLLLRSPLRLLCFVSSVDTRCWLCVRKKERGKREKKEEKDGKKKG
jgi:hypothetical protein